MVEILDQLKAGPLEEAIEKRYEAKKELDAIEVEIDKIEVSLKQVIGANAGIITPSYKITWASQSRKIADADKMKTDGIFEQYSKLVNSRTFRVSKNKVTK